MMHSLDWHYAMQHMGDLESAKSSEQYTEKMQNGIKQQPI